MIAGLEVRLDVVRAVRLRGPRPERTAEAPIEPPLDLGSLETTALSEAIGRVLTQIGAIRSAVAVAAPAAFCLYRPVFFPFRSAGRAWRALEFAHEGRLPTSADACVLEPVSGLGKSGRSGSRLLTAACPEARVEFLLDAFREAGVDPCVVQPVEVSLAEYVALGVRPRPKGTWMAVRIDRDLCQTAVVHGDDVLAARSEPIPRLEAGDKDVAQAVADQIVSSVRADALAGTPLPTSAVVIGEEGMAEPLAQWLHQRMQVETRTAPRDEWAAAIGAALSAAKRGAHAPTLRRKRYAYPPYAAQLPRRIAAALALLVALAGMLGGWLWGHLRTAESDLRAGRSQATLLVREVLGVRRGPATIAALRAAVATARKQASRARRQPVSCLRRWRDLMVLAPDAKKVRFQEIRLSQRGVSLRVKSPDTRQVWAFRERLKASPVFDAEAPVRAGDPDRKQTAFNLELRYRK